MLSQLVVTDAEVIDSFQADYIPSVIPCTAPTPLRPNAQIPYAARRAALTRTARRTEEKPPCHSSSD